MPSPIVIMIIGSVAGVLIAMWIDKKDPALMALLTMAGNMPGVAYLVNVPSYGFFVVLPLLAAFLWRVKRKKVKSRNL